MNLKPWVPGVVLATVTAIILVALALGVMFIFHRTSLPGHAFPVTAVVRSATPLSRSACVRQLREHSAYTTELISQCKQGTGKTWYHAIVRNSGSSAIETYCWAEGYDAAGGLVLNSAVLMAPFSGNRLFWPSLKPGQTIEGTWYFDAVARGPVAHYTTGCTPAPHPD